MNGDRMIGIKKPNKPSNIKKVVDTSYKLEITRLVKKNCPSRF